MNLDDLRKDIVLLETIDQLDDYLKINLMQIKCLFYGMTQDEINEKKFEFEHLFISLLSSEAGTQFSNSTSAPPATINALLVLFLSFFERSKFLSSIQDIINVLPSVPVRNIAKVLWQYKYITDSSKDYTNRFTHIATLLDSVIKEDGCKENVELCIAIFSEFLILSQLNTLPHGINISSSLRTQISQQESTNYLIKNNRSKFVELLETSLYQLSNKARYFNSIIIERLHNIACNFVPEIFSAPAYDDEDSALYKDEHEYKTIPAHVEKGLLELGARYKQDPYVVKMGLTADDERNRIYLGTYFPRSLVETWNIFSELLSVQAIKKSFFNKKSIRIIDFGSGTGGALLGVLFALENFGITNKSVSILSVDGNKDALKKQKKMIATSIANFSFDINHNIIVNSFATRLDDFANDLDVFSSARKDKYDILIFWKYLSEFYNTNYSQALGIIKTILGHSSSLSSSESLSIIGDVTSKDNGNEWFPEILNREVNLYQSTEFSKLTTVCPIPCATNGSECQETRCFTQRIFEVTHSIAPRTDHSKICYRVLAPQVFADKINTISQISSEGYRVNAARPQQACFNGKIHDNISRTVPCGFSSFQ